MRCPLGRKCSRPAVWQVEAPDAEPPTWLGVAYDSPLCEWHAQQVCDSHDGLIMGLV